MSQAVINEAHAFLRGHTRAALRFDEHLRSMKYVIGPDGRLAAPVMVAMLQAVDTVVFVPDFVDGAMELQVTLEQFEEHGKAAAVADRWRIYHGEPEDVRWAFFSVDAARFKGMVIDGDALQRSNPLAEHESRFCREMNQHHTDDLRRLCDVFADFTIEQPVMVGIDSQGLDIRARFDVVRVPASETMLSPADAERVLGAMMARAKAQAGS